MRLPVHIWISERNADPGELAGYFVEIARRMDGSPERMCLVVESSVPASLDVDPADGLLVARIAGGERRFSLRGRWLPEHPVPLELGPGPGGRARKTVLLVDPTCGNRFRVRSCRAFGIPPWAYAAFAALASLAAVTLGAVAIVLAAALAVAAVVLKACPRVCSRAADLFWVWHCSGLSWYGIIGGKSQRAR